MSSISILFPVVFPSRHLTCQLHFHPSFWRNLEKQLDTGDIFLYLAHCALELYILKYCKDMLHFYQHGYVKLDINSTSLPTFRRNPDSFLENRSAKMFAAWFSDHSLRLGILKKKKKKVDRRGPSLSQLLGCMEAAGCDVILRQNACYSSMIRSSKNLK